MNLKKCVVTEYDKFYVLEFKLSEPALSPENFSKTLSMFPIPKDHSKGIVLDGCGSTEFYSAISHKYHSFRFFAKFCPRLNGYQVTINHGSQYITGSVITK